MLDRRLVPAGLRGLLLPAGAPLALPPARVSLSASATPAWSARTDDRSLRRPAASPAFELRTALEPLQLLPGLRDRRYELGLGYLLRTPDVWRATTARHGLFVEGAPTPGGRGSPRAACAWACWAARTCCCRRPPTRARRGGRRLAGAGARLERLAGRGDAGGRHQR